MDKTVAMRIMDIQESLMDDPSYQELLAEHAVLNARFLETVNGLEKHRQDAIFDYLGVFLEMHNRMLELACDVSSES